MLDAPTHVHALAAQVVRCLLKYGARVHLVDEAVRVHECVLNFLARGRALPSGPSDAYA